MDEEFRFHIERRTADLMAGGLPAREAARRARLEFGSTDAFREQGREARGLRLIDELRGDARYGFRALLHSPGFTLTALLTVALGIGAVTSIFSAVDAVLLRPLPFAEPSRLVELDDVGIPLRMTTEEEPATSPQIRDVQSMPEFTQVAGYAPGGLNLSGAGAPRRVRIAAVTTEFFATLGVPPVHGRAFDAAEGEPGGPRVAIVSHALWRAHLGGSPDLAGRTIRLNGRPHEVVGVMPRGFAFPEEAEVWIPLTIPLTWESFEPFRQYLPSRMIARLAPGVPLARAQARVHALFESYATADRPVEAAPADRVRPLQRSLAGQRRTLLLVLIGATGLVLLVACANIANLLLSRGTVRRREIAVRTALGATANRVARQLLTENLLLAAIGGVLGAALAAGGVRLLDALVPPAISGAAPIRVDARVLAFAAAVSLTTGFVFGLLPALRARRIDAGDVLKGGGTGSVDAGQSARARHALVLAQLALAVMLLIGSMLMLRSLHALLTTDSGVEPERVATLELTLARPDYPDRAALLRFYESVIERLEAEPRIEAAAAINELPLRGVGSVRFTVFPVGRRPDAEGRGSEYMAQDLRITPRYFDAMGIRVVRGRAPRPRPDTLSTREVAVNEAYARLFWPDGNPLGDQLEFFDRRYEIVGVVANVRPTTLESGIIPQIYYSLLDTPYANAAIVARGRMPAERLAGILERAVREVAPHQAVYNVRTMEQVVTRAIAPRRTNTALITAFGVLALLLAAIGVYGVIAFSVARRTREIGIRIALGAEPRQVRWAVLREAVALALAGAALGVIGAWLSARVLDGLVYGVSTTDPVAFTVAPLALLITAAVAALAPARRATRVDPVRAIREE